MNFDTLPDTAHITIKVVCTILGVSPSTVWRMVRAGKLGRSGKRLGLSRRMMDRRWRRNADGNATERSEGRR